MEPDAASGGGIGEPAARCRAVPAPPDSRSILHRRSRLAARTIAAVERSTALDHLLGDLGRAQAGHPVGGRSGGGGELEPASPPVAVQPSGAGDPPTFRLKRRDGCLRQVDGTPVDAPDDDPLATTRAALRRDWRRLRAGRRSMGTSRQAPPRCVASSAGRHGGRRPDGSVARSRSRARTRGARRA